MADFPIWVWLVIAGVALAAVLAMLGMAAGTIRDEVTLQNALARAQRIRECWAKGERPGPAHHRSTETHDVDIR